MSDVKTPRAFRFEQILPAAALVVASVSLAVEPAIAHGFGERYDLPLPLNIWLLGAAASIVLSFVVVSFVRGGREPGTSPAKGSIPKTDLLAIRALRPLTSRPAVFVYRLIAACLWLLAIGAGIFGTQDPYHNIAPTLVWVVGWVGLSFACIFFGDLWTTLHPLRSVLDGLDGCAQRLLGRPLVQKQPTSVVTNVWPGLVLFAVFAWLELVWSRADVPYALAWAMAVYSVITLAGMLRFGRTQWLQQGEFFSIAFGVLARFSPFEVRPTTSNQSRAWSLRPPGIALLEGLPLSLSQMLFVTSMLATVTFDGFLETQQWLNLADRLSITTWMQPVLATLRDIGFTDDETISTLGFVAAPLFFVAAILGSAWLTRWAAIGPGGASASEVASPKQIACSLVATLVPIAIAYHLAHYLSMLLVSGQYLIPLASDPFGFGWNMLGTAGYQVDIGIVGVRFVWYSAATAIVLGHIAATVLAHILAQRDFPTRRAATWSQLPFLALMIAYTLLSLWTLAQPIVE